MPPIEELASSCGCSINTVVLATPDVQSVLVSLDSQIIYGKFWFVYTLLYIL